MTAAEAIALLGTYIDASTWPEVSSAELDDLLAQHRRVDPAGNPPTNTDSVDARTGSTAYVAGQVVTDPTYGRYWRCVVAGTTAATSPSWPDLEGLPRTNRRVEDGSVWWEDNGGPWAGRWDLERAAAAGWRLKAGKVAGAHDFGADGQTFDRGQVHKHCLQMADSHRRRASSSVPIG